MANELNRPPIPPEMAAAGSTQTSQAENATRARANRAPLDFIAKKIRDRNSNNITLFAVFLAVSVAALFGAHALHEAFFVEGAYLHDLYSNVETYGTGDDWIEPHWTSIAAFVCHWLCLVGALAAWLAAWWQLGNVNALLAGLIVALVGWWAIGLLDGVHFSVGYDIVSLGDYVPVNALRQFTLGSGLALAGVSLWSYDYKSSVGAWFAYAGSALMLLTGFFAVTAAM